MILFIYFERDGKGERKGQKHQCVGTSNAAPTEDLASNPGMYHDWESNQWPFGLQASAEFTEPHQPGYDASYFFLIFEKFWYFYFLQVLFYF